MSYHKKFLNETEEKSLVQIILKKIDKHLSIKIKTCISWIKQISDSNLCSNFIELKKLLNSKFYLVFCKKNNKGKRNKQWLKQLWTILETSETKIWHCLEFKENHQIKSITWNECDFSF